MIEISKISIDWWVVDNKAFMPFFLSYTFTSVNILCILNKKAWAVVHTTSQGIREPLSKVDQQFPRFFINITYPIWELLDILVKCYHKFITYGIAVNYHGTTETDSPFFSKKTETS